MDAGEGVAVPQPTPGPRRQQVRLPPVGDEAGIALLQRELRDGLAESAADAESPRLWKYGGEPQERCAVGPCGSRVARGDLEVAAHGAADESVVVLDDDVPELRV